jgi:phosphopantothenoylcysteine decarboxylase/phosphopantothenate--cysteine ligase
MGSLANKQIVLGVTGGIAAYKAAEIVRRLREAGADVRVVMTPAACDFITPLTMQALSGHPVHRDLLDTAAEAAMGHIELARWADAVIVAPATANFIARLAQGRGDDLLTAVCLATRAPVAVAPGMNTGMWDNAATQENIAQLKRRGIACFGPAAGALACGETGEGRLLEPALIVERTAELFETGALAGLSVLVTAGPTWEAIDPVRGLTNRSSGKMGYAVASAAMEAGARVILISGPTALPDPARVTTLRVESATEMHAAVLSHLDDTHIFIGVAAVADYRPATTADSKIKKTAAEMNLALVRNPDILKDVATHPSRPFVVGFAAETNDVVPQAREKLLAKNADLIAANMVGDGLGFGRDDNRLTLVERDGITELPAGAKSALAHQLIQHIAERYHAKHPAQDSRRAHRS